MYALSQRKQPEVIDPSLYFSDSQMAPPTHQRTNNSHIKLIYDHDDRLSKRTLQLIRDHGIEPDIIHYRYSPLTKHELLGIYRSLSHHERETMVKTESNAYKNNPFPLHPSTKDFYSKHIQQRLLQQPGKPLEDELIINNIYHKQIELLRSPIVFNAYSNHCVIGGDLGQVARLLVMDTKSPLDRPQHDVDHFNDNPLSPPSNSPHNIDLLNQEYFSIPTHMQQAKQKTFKSTFYQSLDERFNKSQADAKRFQNNPDALLDEFKQQYEHMRGQYMRDTHGADVGDSFDAKADVVPPSGINMLDTDVHSLSNNMGLDKQTQQKRGYPGKQLRSNVLKQLSPADKAKMEGREDYSRTFPSQVETEKEKKREEYEQNRQLYLKEQEKKFGKLYDNEFDRYQDQRRRQNTEQFYRALQ